MNSSTADISEVPHDQRQSYLLNVYLVLYLGMIGAVDLTFCGIPCSLQVYLALEDLSRAVSSATNCRILAIEL